MRSENRIIIIFHIFVIIIVIRDKGVMHYQYILSDSVLTSGLINIEDFFYEAAY